MSLSPTIPFPAGSAAPVAPLQVRLSTPLTKAETELVERHLPLVRSVVDRCLIHLPAHVDADDLHGAGITGLIAAARRFDPTQGCSFATYATTRIRGAILDELRRLDVCTRRTRAKARQLRHAADELEQNLGRAATDEEIRVRLGLTEKNFARWREQTQPVRIIAIDQPADDMADAPSLHEIIADDSVEPVGQRLEREEQVGLVAKLISTLPDAPRKILAMYYQEKMRLVEIAAVFGLTESRICQIHAQTLRQLRGQLERANDQQAHKSHEILMGAAC